MRQFSAIGLASILVLTLGVGIAAAQEPPHQKVGLWRNKITVAGRTMENQSCVDAASEARTSAFSKEAAKNGKCGDRQITHNADGSWTSVATCERRPGVKRTTRTDITGDFNSKIAITLRTPPTAAPSMTMEATWIGPCKPGQRGGDVIMSDGTKMNLLDTPAH